MAGGGDGCSDTLRIRSKDTMIHGEIGLLIRLTERVSSPGSMIVDEMRTSKLSLFIKNLHGPSSSSSVTDPDTH